VASGDLTIGLTAGNEERDEIGNLAQSLDVMRGKLADREEKLLEAQRDLTLSHGELLELNRSLDNRVNERTAALQDSERRSAAILNSAFQLIGLLKPDGTLLEANRAAMSMGNIKREDVIGRPFWEGPWWSHDPELQIQLQEAIRRAAQGETVRFF
jgi:PAS domain-containing protein